MKLCEAIMILQNISRYKLSISICVSVFCCLFLKIETQNNEIAQVSASDCISVNEEEGRCVLLKACPFFVDVLKKRPIRKSHLRLLIQLTCSFDEENPKVCCPLNDIKEPKNSKKSKYPPRSKYKEKLFSYRTHPNFYLLPSFEECGIQVPQIKRISGGKIAYRGQFPFMALLAYKNSTKSKTTNFFCGGTILNERYILTAAHCLREVYGPHPVEIILGEHDLTMNPDCVNVFDSDCSYANIYNIEEVIPHPEYDYSKQSNFDNDVALIRLDREIEYDDFSQPVCLPFIVDYGLQNFPKRLDNISNAIVAGWGRAGSGGPRSSILRFARLPIVLNELCEIDYYQYSQVTAFQICAGGELNIDSCGGDSGGPLLYAYQLSSYPHTKLIQVGITSYGTSFCARGVPGVYTRMTSYLLWILETIKP